MDGTAARSETELSGGLSGTLSLEEQIARLQALLEASRQVHGTIEVNEVLQQTARIVVRELEMEGAFFLLPAVDEPVAEYGSVPAAPYRGCARFKLTGREGQELAELVVVTPGCEEPGLYERDFIEGLVLQAAVALENATLHERDVVWARVQQDLDAARGIQRSLLPKAMPEIAGYSIAGRSSTCYEVGGDYLDAMRLPDGTQLLIVADVAGKGLASAIVATSFRAVTRSLAAQGMALQELAARVGQQHWEEGTESRRRYVTAFFLRLDPGRAEIEVVNAGHNPVVLVWPGGEVRMLEASGTPLGMLPGMGYSAERQPLPPGSRILLYTDGLTEVFQGEDGFGTERLTALFRGSRHAEASGVLDELWETLTLFAAGSAQADDMTALAVVHGAGLGSGRGQEAVQA